MQRRILMASALAALAAAGALGGVTAAQAQTLVMWGPEQITEPLVAELWNGIKADFEAANPGVTVEFMPPTGNISDGAVQAAIQSSAGPDVMLTNSGIARVTTVVNAALVAPLTAAYTERGWDKQIYPWLYDELKSQRGGEIYEVPDGIDAIGLWYHKDIFAENGWTIGGGWADFEALLQQIKDKGLEPLAVGPRNGANGGHLMGNFFQSAVGSSAMGDVVNGNKPWTDAEPVLGAERVVDFAKRGFISPNMGGLDQDNNFCERLAMGGGVPVVSVDYRLAPEHPHPAPINDCWTVYEWLVGGRSGLDVDVRRVVVEREPPRAPGPKKPSGMTGGRTSVTGCPPDAA